MLRCRGCGATSGVMTRYFEDEMRQGNSWHGDAARRFMAEHRGCHGEERAPDFVMEGAPEVRVGVGG